MHTLRDKLGRTAEQTDRLVNELRAHFPDAWVEPGYRELIPVMTNQEKDRHVLAAAVKTRCEVIVTDNLKDFPEESLKAFGIEVKHPDEFLIISTTSMANLSSTNSTNKVPPCTNLAQSAKCPNPLRPASAHNSPS